LKSTSSEYYAITVPITGCVMARSIALQPIQESHNDITVNKAYIHMHMRGERGEEGGKRTLSLIYIYIYFSVISLVIRAIPCPGKAFGITVTVMGA